MSAAASCRSEIYVDPNEIYIDPSYAPVHAQISWRRVHIGSDIVFKIDRYDSVHCGREVQSLLRFSPDDRRYFADIVAYGPGWMAQKRYHFTGEHPAWACDIVDSLAGKYGLRDMDQHDDGSWNWGVTNSGDVVIFDWGYC